MQDPPHPVKNTNRKLRKYYVQLHSGINYECKHRGVRPTESDTDTSDPTYTPFHCITGTNRGFAYLTAKNTSQQY